MRISTSMMYDSGVTQITKLQSALLKTQQQISANTRVLTPSDDPIAAARALDVKQKQALNTQYADNRTQAKNALEQEEASLKTLTTKIQTLQTQVVEAGNASYDDTQRSYIATAMRGTLEELFGLANTQDSSGNYLFSGYQVNTQPFKQTLTGATYNGDQGVRKMQVDTARQMVVSDTGQAVFENIAGSGTFSLDATAGTFASGSISSMSVSDEAAITGQDYQVVFDVTTTGTGTVADPFVTSTTYSIYDKKADPGKTTPLPNESSSAVEVFPSGSHIYSYTSTDTSKTPQEITVGGVSFAVSGTRADGDTLTVSTTAAKNSNQSLFSTLTDLINLLEKSTANATGKGNLGQGLAAASANLANALDNVLTVRAAVGSNLKEIDSLDGAGDDRALQYASTLSDLIDLDTVKAASDLAQQKVVLEAAQQTFVTTTGLSLFNYM